MDHHCFFLVLLLQKNSNERGKKHFFGFVEGTSTDFRFFFQAGTFVLEGDKCAAMDACIRAMEGGMLSVVATNNGFYLWEYSARSPTDSCLRYVYKDPAARWSILWQDLDAVELWIVWMKLSFDHPYFHWVVDSGPWDCVGRGWSQLSREVF